MAHELWLNIQSWVEVGKEDAIFRVHQDEGTFGELRVSKGAVVWYPKGGRVGYKLNWKQFSKAMMDEGTRAESR